MPTSDFATREPLRLGERSSDAADIASLASLLERAQKFRAGPNSSVGDLGRGFIYVVARGVAAVQCATTSDASAVTALLYPGDILMPDLLAPLPGLALIASRPVEFWKLTIASLNEASARDSRLWQALFLRLSAQNARSQLHIAANSGLNCEQRMAGFLIEIGSRLGFSSGGTLSFELPVSRSTIADYLSLNADTVSRTLSAMAAAEIIERRGRSQILIRDRQALSDMCPLSDAIATLHGAGKSAAPTR